jgi:hypothetical protein
MTNSGNFQLFSILLLIKDSAACQKVACGSEYFKVASSQIFAKKIYPPKTS